MYKVELSKDARKSFTALPRPYKKQIAKHINALQEDSRPEGCCALKGHKNTYRIRVGTYRLVYEIRDKQLIITVIAIGHRKDIYRRYA